MKFEHLIFSDNAETENDEREISYIRRIILLNDNIDSEEARAVARTISLDIRGDYGFFLNRNYHDDPEFEWKGNLFRIIIPGKSQQVILVELTGTDNEEGDITNTYTIALDEWNEALLDWKDFYLRELGFKQFEAEELNHVMGVLLLTYDQMDENTSIQADKMDNTKKEMKIFDSDLHIEKVRKAVQRCSERYGISSNTIYNDCKRATGLYDIQDFSLWTAIILGVFDGRPLSLCPRLRKLFDWCKCHIYYLYQVDIQDKVNKTFRVD
ncbi:hypothetical protein [Stomatobaculum longum]|jgi:hypothetical protein|uniref:hypothetical protein n=1 Tax=Stomatobaculum longum TaxID=796942 RepID=UPI0028E5F176|nr:hypothetical protein [Stomatobaculum longum]